MVKAKNTKDIQGLVEKRKAHADKLNKVQDTLLASYKQKLFTDLTPTDKDFLLQMLFIKAGFIKG